MPHPFSLAFLTTAEASALESVQIAARHGYQMIGLRLLPATPAEGDYPLMVDDQVLKDVKLALDDTSVQVADVEIARLNETTKVSQFFPFFERAQILGAKHILVAGDDPDPVRLSETYQEFCEASLEFGLTADLEFMPWTKVPDLKATYDILGNNPKSNAGILVDGLHYDRSNTTLEEIQNIEPNLIHYVQLCDGPADYDPSDEGLIEIARAARLLPGEGGIDLVSLVKAIPDGTPLSIEIADAYKAIAADPDTRAKKAIEAAKKVVTAAGRSWTGAN